MKPAAKKWIKTFLRWGIAIAGVWYIVSNISLYNRVMVLSPSTGRPIPVKIVDGGSEGDASFNVQMEKGGATQTVPRDALIAKSELDKVMIRNSDGTAEPVEVLGLQVTTGVEQSKWPLVVGKPRSIIQRFLGQTHGDRARTIPVTQVEGPYAVRVPYPLVERGLAGMTLQAFNAHPWFLLSSIFVFPIVFFIVSYRWKRIVEAMELSITFATSFALTMVGAFYNTFLPGSTGGDLIKMHYAGRQTGKRTRAWLSVIIDRVIGLLGLVVLGGTMAAYQYFTSHEQDDATHKCGRIALGSAFILVLTLLGVVVFYNRRLRALTGFDFLLSKAPPRVREKLLGAVEAMEAFRTRAWIPTWAVVVTIPVHATVVISAWMAGRAFEIPFRADWYYWVVVPVVVLSGAIPISPQGAGVMEFFAWILMRRQGCTMGHVLALTMSIRLVQILWNLTGVVFVLKGGYHAPRQTEEDLEPQINADQRR
jgi:uncharacterized protein (TIRG00374 family)